MHLAQVSDDVQPESDRQSGGSREARHPEAHAVQKAAQLEGPDVFSAVGEELYGAVGIGVVEGEQAKGQVVPQGVVAAGVELLVDHGDAGPRSRDPRHLPECLARVAIARCGANVVDAVEGVVGEGQVVGVAEDQADLSSDRRGSDEDNWSMEQRLDLRWGRDLHLLQRGHRWTDRTRLPQPVG